MALQKLILRGVSEKKWRNGAGVEYSYKLEISSKDTFIVNIKDQVYKMFDNLVSEVKDTFNAGDNIRIQIQHPSLKRAILVPLRKVEELDTNVIMAEIERVIQSNEELALDNEFTVNVGIIKDLTGSGKKSALPVTDIFQDRKRKRSIVQINNSDELCFARAVVTGMAYLRGPRKSFLSLRSGKKLQERRAMELHTIVNTPAPVSITDIPKFEDHLDINIVVFSAASGNAITYANLRYKETIYLWHVEVIDNMHYDLIVKPGAFLGKDYFCAICLKGYKHHGRHIRAIKCFCGLKQCAKVEEVFCSDCNRSCRSRQCFTKHKSKGKYGKSLCERTFVCKFCAAVWRRGLPHKCGSWQCSNCKMVVSGVHKCYQRATMPEDIGYNYIDFDFETDQSSGEHVPNMVVAYKSCVECIDTPTSEQEHCESCGDRDFVFQGYDCTVQFCQWLLQKEHRGYTVRAHNASGFDNHFVLKYLVENSIVPEIIYNGSKIVYMFVRRRLNIRFIDTLLFLPMRLADFPKTFGLTEQKKGYFPHYFNTKENMTYVGKLPGPEMYGVDDMKENDRKTFFEWYNSQTEMFNMKKELELYCRSDVDILQRGCNQFRKLLLSLTSEDTVDRTGKKIVVGVDPFQYLTIASVCMAIFKFKFIREYVTFDDREGYVQGTRVYDMNGKEEGHTSLVKHQFQRTDIARVPCTGYQTHSKESIQWLECNMLSKNVHIQHARNGGEQKIGDYMCDGYDEANKTVYEFHGCLWHGCPKCYPDKNVHWRVVHPHTKQTMADLYRVTKQKEAYIKREGYSLEVIWECEFRKLKAVDPDLVHFCNTLKLPEKLDARDAFFGGRTSALCTHYKCHENEKIGYVDFTSLYPYVNKYCSYPIGHPTIVRDNFGDFKSYFGLAKVTVLPPRGLYHPVLPYRCNGKLFFPLCRTCAKNKAKNICLCSDDDRQLTGTWVTLEINKALDMGYILKDIHEIHHFEQTSDVLFKEYINTFLKYKQEASDWPKWVKSTSDCEKYIKDYKEHEGIQLDPSGISHNPGLRCVSKLALNSFWGKFGQRASFQKHKIVNSHKHLLQLIVDQTLSVEDFNVINDYLLNVVYKRRDEFVTDGNTNIYIEIGRAHV